MALKSLPSFHDLQTRVIDTRLCLLCGACVAICPANSIGFGAGGPELVGDCRSCGLCFPACPGKGVPIETLDSMLFHRSRTGEEDLGGFGIRIADRDLAAGDEEIRRRGYTGGKVTALLARLLDRGDIDAAIVSRWGSHSPHPWFSWPCIAASRDDLLACTGSKYVFSPTLMALADIAGRRDISSVAVVGLGCHVAGLRLMSHLGDPYRRLTEKVRFVFGLYCGAPMLKPEDTLSCVGRLCSVEPGDIAAIDFRRVSEQFDVAFELTLRDGRTVSVARNILRVFAAISRYDRWDRCSLCTDYSAEFADISFGGIHVTTRTEQGEDLVQSALADGTLAEQGTGESFARLASRVDRTMANMKKNTNRRFIAERRRDGKPAPEYE